MASRWIQAPTELVRHTATAARAALDVVVLTDMIGIAMAAITSGSEGSLGINGVVRLPHITDTATDGDRLFWDTGSTGLSIVATGNTFIGVARGAIASAATEGELVLNRGNARATGA